MAGTSGTGGTGTLLEMLERQSARAGAPPGGPGGGIPAPRRTSRHVLESAVVLPETRAAAVTGPAAPAPTDDPSAAPTADPTTDPGHRGTAAPGVRAPDRRSRLRVLVGVAGLGLVAACWSGASALLADRVPDGATVAGVSIGGLDRDDAVRLVSARLEPRLAEPLPVSAGGRTATIDPVVAGLHLDAAASVSRAIGPVGLPTTLWHQLRGGGAVDPVVLDSTGDLGAAVDRVAVALDVPAVDGSVSFATGQPVATQPVTGTSLDRGAATRLVERAWLAPAGAPDAVRPLPLPTRQVVSPVTSAAVAAAVAQEAVPAVAAPLTVVVGERRVVLQPAQVAPALSMVTGAGALHLHVDGAVLADAVVAADPSVRTPARDAVLDTSSGAVVVVPSADGTEPDPSSLPEAAARALVAPADDAAARTATATTRAVAAGRSTDDVSALGITTLLGQVVSPLTADPARTRDVSLAAAALDGTFVDPGTALDLGSVVGEPTQEAGYVPAAVVVGGRATTTTSAGSTQLASALTAAAYAAGMELTERTAPASWNPRDPVGLDAVVAAGTPLVIGVPGDESALVRAEVTGGALRVQVWGPASRTVALQTSAAQDPRPATVVVDASPSCVPQPGQDGFTTTVVRTTTPAAGAAGAAQEATTDQITTTYAPRSAVTCTAPSSVAATPLALD